MDLEGSDDLRRGGDRKPNGGGEGVPGGAAEFVGLAARGEDDEADLGVAENSELAGFLEKAAPPLGKAHLAAGLVLDSPNLDLPPSHRRHRRRQDPKLEPLGWAGGLQGRTRTERAEAHGGFQTPFGSGTSPLRSGHVGVVGTGRYGIPRPGDGLAASSYRHAASKATR